MTQLKILYLGAKKWTGLDRANAFKRLGHQVEHIDLRELLPKTNWVDRFTWKVGGDLFAPWLLRALPKLLNNQQFDICYVDGGEWVTPKVIYLLHQYAKKVINYSIDDPLGNRDAARNKAYRKSVPHYDLCVVMRPHNIAEAEARGAKNILRVYMSADEVAHAPRPLTSEDHAKWDCDVLFLGTWMPERGQFLVSLVEKGVPLTIRGSSWQRAPEWSILKNYWKGPGVYGDEYAKVIQCAKVSLGLLSKGNRDLHTTRSAEIPALGGLLCAERTSEHTQMYQEGVEALFWSDVDECAAMCKYALDNEEERQAIAEAGHARVKENGQYNEPTLQSIIDSTINQKSITGYMP